MNATAKVATADSPDESSTNPTNSVDLGADFEQELKADAPDFTPDSDRPHAFSPALKLARTVDSVESTPEVEPSPASSTPAAQVDQAIATATESEAIAPEVSPAATSVESAVNPEPPVPETSAVTSPVTVAQSYPIPTSVVSPAATSQPFVFQPPVTPNYSNAGGYIPAGVSPGAMPPLYPIPSGTPTPAVNPYNPYYPAQSASTAYQAGFHSEAAPLPVPSVPRVRNTNATLPPPPLISQNIPVNPPVGVVQPSAGPGYAYPSVQATPAIYPGMQPAPLPAGYGYPMYQPIAPSYPVAQPIPTAPSYYYPGSPYPVNPYQANPYQVNPYQANPYLASPYPGVQPVPTPYTSSPPVLPFISNQPVPVNPYGYPAGAMPGYPTGAMPGYPTVPVPGYPATPVPGYPYGVAQPVPVPVPTVANSNEALTPPTIRLQAGVIYQADELSARGRVTAAYPITPNVLVGGTLDLVTGEAFTPDEDAGIDLNELYVAASLPDMPNLRFVVGQVDLTSYFDRNSFAKDVLTHFFNPVFQTNPALSAATLAPRPAALMNWSISDNLEARVAAFSSDPDLGDLDLNGFAGEIGFRAGNFILRGTYVSALDGGARSGFEDVFELDRGDGTEGVDSDDRETAYGINAELFIPELNMGLFGRYGFYNNEELDEDAITYSFGVNLLDLFMQGDRLGVGYGQGLANYDLVEELDEELPDVLEVFYDAQIHPNVRLGFSVQQLNDFSETIAGFRIRADFDASPKPSQQP